MFNIGIVGAGIIGLAHKDAVMNNKECILKAICDINISKALSLAEGTEASAYDDYKIMQEKEFLDAVILNLPHYLHKEAAVYFLGKGVNVLCEKPMAISTEECGIMQKAAEKSGAKLAIAHLQRFFECYRELKKIIEEERLGKLCLVTETRNTNYFNNRPQWFLEKKKSGGGIVMNYCAHTLDKLFYLLGTDVESVKANVENTLNDCDIESQAQVLMKMSDGVSAAFSYCATRIKYMYETYFYFTDGFAKIENGKYLWIAENDAELKRVELDYEKSAIESQLCEFIKFLKNEATEIVKPDYGKKIISVIEEILQ